MKILLAIFVSLSTTKALAKATPIEYPELIQQTMCIPVNKVNDSLQIVDMCDASNSNRVYDLKLNQKGCAVVGQTEDIYGTSYEQIAYIIEAADKNGLKQLSLPPCDIFSVFH